MKAAIHVNSATHQKAHASAIRQGLRRHGVQAEFAGRNEAVPGVDFSVMWGWRSPAVVAAAPHVLVMERGYLPDRFVWSSCGWGGLNGRAHFPQSQDGGERFNEHFSHMLKPWRAGGDYALLIGQVAGDAATRGLNLKAWMRNRAVELQGAGYAVLYRPHPFVVRCYGTAGAMECCPKGVEFSRASLEEDLRRAALVVTYNSNTGVEAILAGVPTVTFDEGSMSWPVTTHSVTDPPWRPDRTEWCRRLSWCQWEIEEIRSGAAWEVLRECME